MRDINNGGSAYPCEGGDHSGLVPDAGMTIRDRIAIEALGGMLAHPTRYKPRNAFQHWHEAISEEAYEIADAMIAARSSQ